MSPSVKFWIKLFMASCIGASMGYLWSDHEPQESKLIVALAMCFQIAGYVAIAKEPTADEE